MSGWQKAKVINTSMIWVGSEIWVFGPPKPCKCGNPPEHFVYTSNVDANGTLLQISANYVELLSEFTAIPDLIKLEIGVDT